MFGGVGTTSPVHNLEIKGSFPDFAISDSDTANDKFRILHNGGSTQIQVDPNNVSAGSHLLIAVDNTERARIDSSGRLLVGASTSRAIGDLSSCRLQVEGTDGTGSAASLINNQNSVGRASIRFGKSRGTALNSNTVVAANDTLGEITWCGADGTDSVSYTHLTLPTIYSV